VASSIPFRFKAGGSGNGKMAPENHHHRSTTKQSKKGFKSRHATKSALKEVSKGMDRPHAPLRPPER
jgi:pre-rRNA-processing protein TSR1